MVTTARKRAQKPAQRATAALPKVSEKVFQAQVEKYLRLMGWLCYHTYLSIKSAPGFPDLVCVRAGRVAFIELKAEAGKATPTQILWGQALSDVGGTVEYHLWRPSDWPEIEQVMR